MFSTDNHRHRILAPLLADLFEELLDRGTGINKASPETHIMVECVGDSRDADPSRASESNLEQLETKQKEGPAEASALPPASFPSHSPIKGQRKKSILTTKTKTNPIYKEKLLRRLRLLFAPDEDIPSMPFKEDTEPSLESKLTLIEDGARLLTRLDALTKRVLTLESKLDNVLTLETEKESMQNKMESIC